MAKRDEENMRVKRLRCYVGNYDGMRDGLIYAHNAVEASHVIHCSLYQFRQYWRVHTLYQISNPKPLVLYTRKNDYRSEWHEGICDI